MPDPQMPTITTYDPDLARLIADYVLRQLGLVPGAKTPPNGTIAARQIVWVKITGNAAGGGKYKARLFSPGTIEISSSGNLTATDFGILADADNVLFLNGEECDVLDDDGNPTHVLTDNGETPLAMGTHHGLNTESPPLHVVRGLSLLSAGCADSGTP